MSSRAGAQAHRRTGAPRARAAVPLCVCALLSSCAYYNGMYNVKRYAKQAQRSERAGRTGEAADRWRQVIVHADTLLARHSRSRWADDAQLLRGRAYVQLGAWPPAVDALEAAIRVAGADEQRLEAHYWLGLAYTGRRDAAAALRNLDSVVARAGSARRSAALLARGRVLLAQDRAAEALADFLASDQPDAPFERARAALRAGDVATAAAWADTAAASAIREEAWRPFLDSLARYGGVDAGARLVDALVHRGDRGVGARARFLLADAERWRAAGREDTAAARWTAVERLVPDSVEGRLASVRLRRAALRGPAGSAALPEARARLSVLAEQGGEPAREAAEVLRLIGPADGAQGDGADALAFLRAEVLRDSLGAPTLAADAFGALAAGHPGSPWAAKALVAAIAAGHPAADSLRDVLTGRYGDSPYALAATGALVDPDAYAALEDSLDRALATLLRGAAAPADSARAAPPGEDEEDVRLRNQRPRPRPRVATPAQPRPAPRPPTPNPDP